MHQTTFLSLGKSGKRLRCDVFLDEMEQVVPWSALCDVIRPYYYDPARGGRGRQATDLERLIRIVCLQQWYALSDPAVEEALYDRHSFQRFVGLDAFVDTIPDETTILRFRHLLEAHDLFRVLFETINAQLSDAGLLMQRGTAVDATLIAASPSTKNKAKARDPEMSSTKKNNQWYFGMKAHIGADTDSGLVHGLEVSPAKTHDSRKTDDLLHGHEQVIVGDAAYGSKARKQACRAQGVIYGIVDKRTARRPLSNGQRKRNRQWSSVRAKVEHPFRVLKCQFGYRKVRYRGLAKNGHQLYLLFGLVNLYMSRRRLMALAG